MKHAKGATTKGITSVPPVLLRAEGTVAAAAVNPSRRQSYAAKIVTCPSICGTEAEIPTAS